MFNFLKKNKEYKTSHAEKLAKIKASYGPSKQVIIVRKDLGMRKGKLVAQGSHASMGAIFSIMETKYSVREFGNPNNSPVKFIIPSHEGSALYDWISGRFTKICVSVNSEEEILELERQAKEAGLLHCLITDSGKTEFNNVPTITALAIGPAWSSKIDPITKHLPLI